MSKLIPSILVLLLLLYGCAEPRDLLIGQWQVVSVNRDGEVLGGPGFNGTIFEFTEDGRVFTANSIENNEVGYRREGQYLIYEADGMQERYRIDSLSETMLVIYSDADGVPTTTGMKRLGEME